MAESAPVKPAAPVPAAASSAHVFGRYRPDPLPVAVLVGRERSGNTLCVSTEPVTVFSRDWGLKFTVPAGYLTDWASIPAFAQVRFQPFGRHAWAAFAHDWLYTVGEPGGRALADAIFAEKMAEAGVNLLRRGLMHGAVRAGGWMGWRRAEAWWADAFADPETGERTPPPFPREAAFLGGPRPDALAAGLSRPILTRQGDDGMFGLDAHGWGVRAWAVAVAALALLLLVIALAGCATPGRGLAAAEFAVAAAEVGYARAVARGAIDADGERARRFRERHGQAERTLATARRATALSEGERRDRIAAAFDLALDAAAIVRGRSAAEPVAEPGEEQVEEAPGQRDPRDEVEREGGGLAEGHGAAPPSE